MRKNIFTPEKLTMMTLRCTRLLIIPIINRNVVPCSAVFGVGERAELGFSVLQIWRKKSEISYHEAVHQRTILPAADAAPLSKKRSQLHRNSPKGKTSKCALPSFVLPNSDLHIHQPYFFFKSS